MFIRQSTIDSEGFKGGTQGAPIMPRDAVSRTANVERTARHIGAIIDELINCFVFFKAELATLGGEIQHAQSLLPATGVPMPLSRNNSLQPMFDEYVRQRCVGTMTEVVTWQNNSLQPMYDEFVRQR